MASNLKHQIEYDSLIEEIVQLAIGMEMPKAPLVKTDQETVILEDEHNHHRFWAHVCLDRDTNPCQEINLSEENTKLPQEIQLNFSPGGLTKQRIIEKIQEKIRVFGEEKKIKISCDADMADRREISLVDLQLRQNYIYYDTLFEDIVQLAIGTDMPPVEVQGTAISDGHHRYFAHVCVGRETILCKESATSPYPAQEPSKFEIRHSAGGTENGDAKSRIREHICNKITDFCVKEKPDVKVVRDTTEDDLIARLKPKQKTLRH